MQQGLYQRALEMRTQHTRVITNEKEFREFFTPKNEESPEIHGGFALCHFHDSDVVQPLLKELKVTIRCIPRDHNDTPAAVSTPVNPPKSKRSLQRRISGHAETGDGEPAA